MAITEPELTSLMSRTFCDQKTQQAQRANYARARYISDFQALISKQYFFVDRTCHIRHIEAAGEQLLFLHPNKKARIRTLLQTKQLMDVLEERAQMDVLTSLWNYAHYLTRYTAYGNNLNYVTSLMRRTFYDEKTLPASVTGGLCPHKV